MDRMPPHMWGFMATQCICVVVYIVWSVLFTLGSPNCSESIGRKLIGRTSCRDNIMALCWDLHRPECSLGFALWLVGCTWVQTRVATYQCHLIVHHRPSPPSPQSIMPMHINRPDLVELMQCFLHDQLYTDGISANEIPLEECSEIHTKILVFSSATATFYALSGKCGL